MTILVLTTIGVFLFAGVLGFFLGYGWLSWRRDR